MTGHPRFPLLGPLVALTAALALLPASAPAQNNNQATEIATYHGPDREKRLIEGAKKEGELMLYASVPVADIAVLTEAFTKKYGIKVKAWRGDSEAMLQRVLNEAKARRYEVGVMVASSSALEPLSREKLLTEVKSPLLADLDSGVGRAQPRMGVGLPQYLRAGLQHQAGQQGRIAEDLSRPPQPALEGPARGRGGGLRLVRAGRARARRSAGPQAVPRHRGDQRDFGAPRPLGAEQSDRGRRGPARAQRLRLPGRAVEAQGRADRLVRHSAAAGAADRRRRVALRAAAACRGAVLRFPDRRGAADPGQPAIRVAEPQDRTRRSP